MNDSLGLLLLINIC